MESIFYTILSGVLVFIVSQYFLKLVLEPIISFRESLGRLSAFCLRYNSKITNGHADNTLHDELRNVVSSILAKQNAIMFYDFTRILFCGPSKQDTLKGCKCLNFVGYEMNKDIDKNSKDCIQISKNLKQAENLLKLRLNYEEL